jgi:hypothetical protein
VAPGWGRAEAVITRCAGFFCGGEIGPVGVKAFLHGFTATLALLLEDKPPRSANLGRGVQGETG